MLRLHVFAAPWGINPSPFCLKVETYCRLAGIPFECVQALPFRAPKGKLPFITDGDATVADSGRIIDHLKTRYGDPLDAALDEEQRARGHLIRRCCEESLYFVLLDARWIDPEGWRTVKPVFFGPLPPVLRDMIAMIARRGIRRALRGQGYGRHTPEEILALGAADLAAIATAVAPYPFAVGARPTSFDASLYGLLANILLVPVETGLAREARRHPGLTAYLDRMRAELG
ncbi:MAG TPA: glutathione S-transferase family protein [Aliidongia sp.]|nr:glutathione S-transferase family protein [Aliidongia sp.]